MSITHASIAHHPRLQLVTKYIVICLVYSPALPICYVITALFLWIGISTR